MRLLLVESHAPLRDITRELLEKRGFEVVAAADGREAVALARLRGPYDLLMVDGEAPGVRGVEPLAGLSESALGAPLILWTSRLQLGERDRARLNVAAVLRKPLALSELAEAVGRRLPAAAKPAGA